MKYNKETKLWGSSPLWKYLAHLVYRSVICLNAFPFAVHAGFVEVPENSAYLPSEVNINPLFIFPAYNKPLIHVYEKEFTSEICCGSLWGEFEFLKLSFVFVLF